MATAGKLLAIVGPTASGKTEIAHALAKRYGGEILCADSRAIYRGMDIGTAKPGRRNAGSAGTGDQKANKVNDTEPQVIDGIRYYFLDIIDPSETYSTAKYQQNARKRLGEIWERKALPMLVGGTGLYIRSVVDGFIIPANSTHSKLRMKLEKQSLPVLVRLLEQQDPQAFSTIDLHNPRRVIRALEICMTTGRPGGPQRVRGDTGMDILQIGILVARQILYARINQRVDRMIEQGWIEEARLLGERYGWDAPGMTGIGYRQIGRYVRGELDREETIRLIKQDTRHLAKRQMTWFRKDTSIVWIETEAEARKQIDTWLGQDEKPGKRINVESE